MVGVSRFAASRPGGLARFLRRTCEEQRRPDSEWSSLLIASAASWRRSRCSRRRLGRRSAWPMEIEPEASGVAHCTRCGWSLRRVAAVSAAHWSTRSRPGHAQRGRAAWSCESPRATQRRLDSMSRRAPRRRPSGRCSARVVPLRPDAASGAVAACCPTRAAWTERGVIASRAAATTRPSDRRRESGRAASMPLGVDR